MNRFAPPKRIAPKLHTKQCTVCGEEFEIARKRSIGRRCCSPRCAGQEHRERVAASYPPKVELEALYVEQRLSLREFWRADALEVLRSRGTSIAYHFAGSDVIHASPPCKLFTVANRVHAAVRPTLFEPHADLLTPTRELLRQAKVPYVIENVPGAPMVDAVTYCGSAFGLRVRRHRLFESNVAIPGSGCRHDLQPEVVGVYGAGGAWTRTAPGGGGVKVAGAEAAAALGIDWTDRQSELSQAIPPAYTEHIGGYLMAEVERRARAAA